MPSDVKTPAVPLNQRTKAYYWTKDDFGMLWQLADHSYDNIHNLGQQGTAVYMSYSPDGSDLFKVNMN